MINIHPPHIPIKRFLPRGHGQDNGGMIWRDTATKFRGSEFFSYRCVANGSSAGPTIEAQKGRASPERLAPPQTRGICKCLLTYHPAALNATKKFGLCRPLTPRALGNKVKRLTRPSR
jgi:hypothetical protein